VHTFNSQAIRITKWLTYIYSVYFLGAWLSFTVTIYDMIYSIEHVNKNFQDEKLHCSVLFFSIIRNADEEESEEAIPQIFEPSSDVDDCIPVQAVKDLDCPLSTTNAMFKDLFNSICHQHQLCYACVNRFK